MTSCGSSPTGMRAITFKVRGSTMASMWSVFESASKDRWDADWAWHSVSRQMEVIRKEITSSAFIFFIFILLFPFRVDDVVFLSPADLPVFQPYLYASGMKCRGC